jgi:endonuclease/exonuclease/phosphatase family metal-dependent hydrolase
MPISFNVMTWNLENLFSVGQPSGPKDPAVYDRKMRNIAQTMLAIAPDVVGLQEVGDDAALADLQRRLGDRYPYTMVSSHPDGRGIRNVFLSRFPLVQAREMRDFPPAALNNLCDAQGDPIKRMGRGVIKATVVLAQGVLINVVNCHLKSKLVTYQGGRRFPLDESERARETAAALIRRTAEAVAVRVYINHLVTSNSDPLVLMGDMNDEPDAITTQIMQGPEDRSLQQRDKFDDIRLYNLAPYIAPERRYSRMYHKERELIDHIMVSHELIFYRRQVDAFIEPISNVDNDPDARREEVYPDHAPIFARFELPDPERKR